MVESSNRSGLWAEGILHHVIDRPVLICPDSGVTLKDASSMQVKTNRERPKQITRAKADRPKSKPPEKPVVVATSVEDGWDSSGWDDDEF